MEVSVDSSDQGIKIVVKRGTTLDQGCVRVTRSQKRKLGETTISVEKKGKETLVKISRKVKQPETVESSAKEPEDEVVIKTEKKEAEDSKAENVKNDEDEGGDIVRKNNCTNFMCGDLHRETEDTLTRLKENSDTLRKVADEAEAFVKASKSAERTRQSKVKSESKGCFCSSSGIKASRPAPSSPFFSLSGSDAEESEDENETIGKAIDNDADKAVKANIALKALKDLKAAATKQLLSSSTLPLTEDTQEPCLPSPASSLGDEECPVFDGSSDEDMYETLDGLSGNEALDDESCDEDSKEKMPQVMRKVKIVKNRGTAKVETSMTDPPEKDAIVDTASAKALSALVGNLAPPKPNEQPPASDNTCAICLEVPVHPIALECGHRFCYLCAKGLVEGGNSQCSLCRRYISQGFFRQQVLSAKSVAKKGVQWFYQAGNGVDWWKFEERNSDELEDYYHADLKEIELLICGHIYVIDFRRMTQKRKNGWGRVRMIKRGDDSEAAIGVAGLRQQ